MIEHWDPLDPAGRVRCQTYSKFGAHCTRYQDHGGEHYYAFRSAQSRWLAPKPTDETPELSEGV